MIGNGHAGFGRAALEKDRKLRYQNAADIRADLERLSIDVGALERRRDRLVPALRELGYEATMPEGTMCELPITFASSSL